jgi:hypothetical protein
VGRKGWQGAELIEMEMAGMLRVATAGVMNEGRESKRLELRSKPVGSSPVFAGRQTTGRQKNRCKACTSSPVVCRPSNRTSSRSRAAIVLGIAAMLANTQHAVRIPGDNSFHRRRQAALRPQAVVSEA